MFSSPLNDRQSAFLMVALLFDPRHVQDMISLCPAADSEALQAALRDFHAQHGADEAKQVLRDELHCLVLKARRSLLADIHPDWIIETLMREAPRVISVLLRTLPGHQVTYALEHLPPETLARLPSLAETFSVDAGLSLVIKKIFERNFVLPTPLCSSVSGFDSVPFLSGEKLERLFREIGFREMAMAFGTLNESSANLILRRLPPRDAALLKPRLQTDQEKSSERAKQAQAHLLSLDLHRGSAQTLVLEVGFFVYSKALLPANAELALAMKLKFSRLVGELLEKYISRNLSLNAEPTALKYQHEILRVVGDLARAKK